AELAEHGAPEWSGEERTELEDRDTVEHALPRLWAEGGRRVRGWRWPAVRAQLHAIGVQCGGAPLGPGRRLIETDHRAGLAHRTPFRVVDLDYCAEVAHLLVLEPFAAAAHGLGPQVVVDLEVRLPFLERLGADSLDEPVPEG